MPPVALPLLPFGVICPKLHRTIVNLLRPMRPFIQRGAIAYFGTWRANEADKTLIVNIEADTFPNFAGTTQKRHFEISGD